MKLREQPNNNIHEQEEQNPAPGNPPGNLADENLNNLREAAERLLAAGDNAINRALSGNSEAFLEANKQQGGQ